MEKEQVKKIIYEAINSHMDVFSDYHVSEAACEAAAVALKKKAIEQDGADSYVDRMKENIGKSADAFETMLEDVFNTLIEKDVKEAVQVPVIPNPFGTHDSIISAMTQGRTFGREVLKEYCYKGLIMVISKRRISGSGDSTA